MYLVTTLIVKSSLILAGIHIIFLKKHPRPNLKGFQYHIRTSVIKKEQFQQLFANCVTDLTDTKIVKQINIKRGREQVRSKRQFSETIMGKILETNFSFHMK